MSRLVVKVFGNFAVALDSGSPVSFRTTRAAEVVALLAMQPAGQLDRRKLADAIWPEMLPSEQLRSLRPALHYAKSSVGGALQVDDRSGLVSLEAESEWQDAKKLELRIAAEVDAGDRLMLLYALSNLIREPLFGSWDRLWMEPYRHRNTSVRCRVQFGLAELLGSKGENEMALEHIRQARLLNPMDEAAIKLQLQLLGKLDRVAEARQTFRDFKSGTREVSEDVAAVARKALSGGYAETRSRIVSSVQLEFVHELLEVLAEEAPERLLPLLAAQQVNWAVVSHGPELKSLLESVLERTSGWAPDRADVAKRILQYYGQEGEFQHMRTLAMGLNDSPRPNDQVAALNYLAMESSNAGRFGEAEAFYREAVDLCENKDLTYLRAVTLANLCSVDLAQMRLDQAQFILESVLEGLSVENEPNARYSIARCRAVMIHIHVLRGDFDRAFRLAQEGLKLVQLDEAVRKDSVGLATISLAYAQQGSPLALQLAIKALDEALSGRQKVKMHSSALIVCAAARLIGLESAAIEAARELLAWSYVFRLELCELDKRMYADAGLVPADELMEAPTSLPKILVNLREALELHDSVGGDKILYGV